MDSFNVISSLAAQSSTPEFPLGILILCCCLKNLTEIGLLWLESTPRASLDGVYIPSSASKYHI